MNTVALCKTMSVYFVWSPWGSRKGLSAWGVLLQARGSSACLFKWQRRGAGNGLCTFWQWRENKAAAPDWKSLMWSEIICVWEYIQKNRVAQCTGATLASHTNIWASHSKYITVKHDLFVPIEEGVEIMFAISKPQMLHVR